MPSTMVYVMIMVNDKDDPAVPTLVTGPTPDPSGPDCSDAVGNAGGANLESDCQILLDSEDALGGSLNWDVGTDIMEWDGVNIRRRPRHQHLPPRHGAGRSTIPASARQVGRSGETAAP